MKQLIMVSTFFLSLNAVAFQPENFISAEGRQIQDALLAVGILKYWFFVGPTNNLEGAIHMKPETMIVRDGQTFGVYLLLKADSIIHITAKPTN